MMLAATSLALVCTADLQASGSAGSLRGSAPARSLKTITPSEVNCSLHYPHLPLYSSRYCACCFGPCVGHSNLTNNDFCYGSDIAQFAEEVMMDWKATSGDGTVKSGTPILRDPKLEPKVLGDWWCQALGWGDEAVNWKVIDSWLPQQVNTISKRTSFSFSSTANYDCQARTCLTRLQCTGGFVPDKEKAANAFWQAVNDKGTTTEDVAKSHIKDNWPAIIQAVADAHIANAKEFAMFMGNVMQESAELTTKVEDSTHSKDVDFSGLYNWNACGKGVKIPCEGADCPTTHQCKMHYFGRGYLQTTWYKNYKEAKEEGNCTEDSHGNTVDIVADPGKVGEDEALAWCATAFYWKKNVHDDRCKSGCEMGNTINAINADRECSNGDEDPKDGKAKAQRRFCHYRTFYDTYTEGLHLVDQADSICISDLDGKCPLK